MISFFQYIYNHLMRKHRAQYNKQIYTISGFYMYHKQFMNFYSKKVKEVF